ncbi:MAG: nitrilase-related carbon-nitrogen hydrolase [Halanaerobium sp.]|nr:nitrilase-related carbon-nitrogen hydrolase [Halanaerobium sp.]
MSFLDEVKQLAFKTQLKYKTRKKKITKVLGKMEYKYREDAPRMSRRKKALEEAAEERKFTAGAVQMQWELIKEPETFVADMYYRVFEASREDVHLLVFPEDMGLQLLGLIPNIEEMAGGLLAEGDEADGGEGGRDSSFRDLFQELIGFMTPIILHLYLQTFRRLARRFQMYIMGGSLLIRGREGLIYNRAYLFGPEGNVIGYQDKLHLLPIEAGWGVSQGRELKAYNTPLGRIAFPICMDATYFETFRIMEKMGVEVVLLPTANPEEYNFWKALRGIWPRIQESSLFGIKSTMVGKFLGMSFTGKAGFYGPRGLTVVRDGIIAETDSYDRDQLLVAEIDLNLLARFRAEESGKGELQEEVIARYLPQLYDNGGEDTEEG